MVPLTVTSYVLGPKWESIPQQQQNKRRRRRARRQRGLLLHHLGKIQRDCFFLSWGSVFSDVIQHIRRLITAYMRLCDVFLALMNSLVCWFCMSALGLVPFQIITAYPTNTEWESQSQTAPELSCRMHARVQFLIACGHQDPCLKIFHPKFQPPPSKNKKYEKQT